MSGSAAESRESGKSGKVERERRTETELRQGGRMETERRVREERN